MKLGDKQISDRIISYWLVGFIALLLCSFCARETLENIPSDDREDLTTLFSCFICTHHFAYTLFGDKPVSFASMPLSISPKLLMCGKGIRMIFRSHQNQLAKWEVWKKHALDLQIEDFLFIEEISQIDSNTEHIFLINKRAASTIIDEHRELFQSILSKNVTGKSLTAEIEKNGSLRGSLNHNELLLGILLGYGKSNALLFQKRATLHSLFRSYQAILFVGAPLLKELNQQSNRISEILKPVGCNPLRLIMPVQFVADENILETKQLISKYRSLEKEIAEVYSQKDVLVTTLERLTLIKK